MPYPDDFNHSAWVRRWEGNPDADPPLPRRAPTHGELMHLWRCFMEWIDAKHIHVAESIYQRDDVLDEAATMIERACEIVGYSPAGAE